MNFVLNEVLGAPDHYKALGVDLAPDFLDSINQACAQFAQEELAPLYSVGDREGCTYMPNSDVKTPTGYKEAYNSWSEAGWNGLTVPEEYGGQGMPLSMGIFRTEICGTANWSFNMYPGLSMGAMNTLLLHASEEQKQQYLTKLTTGQWAGTMCLTEPHCGTDLGQVATKATANGDGSYNLTGTKIYISGGEHDLTENIVHIVLARLPGAPAGTKGISLFLVPKHIEKADGTLEEEKNVVCAGIEHKMGIRSSATAVLAFENSKGWLIGKENDGLNQMFTFMNTARLGTALQGVCHMERAYQGALPWAMDRASMRSLSGKKYPDDVADKIIVHGDVRKMLLTIKALSEGGRCMMYDAAMLADTLLDPDEKVRDDCEDHLGLHTPTMKAFLTEMGQECTSLGMQIYGGAGFIKDYGMEQIHRDAIISTKYEGTTGVQALDLLGRKIILDKGNQLKDHIKRQMGAAWDIGTGAEAGNHGIRGYAFEIAKMSARWGLLVAQILKGAASNKDIIGTASVDFLMYTGYMSVGYQWLRMMNAASSALSSDPNMAAADRAFYQSKIDTGKFYFERLLPRADAHAKMCVKNPDSIMDMQLDGWDLATTLPSDSGQAYGRGFNAEN
jgi:alkylation response protein AidB-like acyl-CoA dehydrogenase